MKVLIKDFEYAKLQRKRAKQDRLGARDRDRKEWCLHFAWWPVKMSEPDFPMNLGMSYDYKTYVADWRWFEYVERRGSETYGKWSYRYRPLRAGAALRIVRHNSSALRFEGRRWFYYLTPVSGAENAFSLRETYRNDPDFIVLFPSAKYEPHEPYFVKVILSDADAVHLKMMLE